MAANNGLPQLGQDNEKLSFESLLNSCKLAVSKQNLWRSGRRNSIFPTAQMRGRWR